MFRNSKRPGSSAKRRRATLSISTERSTSVTRALGNFSATIALRSPVPAPRSSTRISFSVSKGTLSSTRPRRSHRSPERGGGVPCRNLVPLLRTKLRSSRRFLRHDVESYVIQGRRAVRRRHLLRNLGHEGFSLLFGQPLEVPAEHDGPEKACELVDRVERRHLVVQPRLDLLKSHGFEASRG